jgi:hypothetical protein
MGKKKWRAVKTVKKRSQLLTPKLTVSSKF